MELEIPLLNELSAPWMGTVDDRHLVGLCHVIDGSHQGKEMLLIVDVLFHGVQRLGCICSSQV